MDEWAFIIPKYFTVLRILIYGKGIKRSTPIKCVFKYLIIPRTPELTDAEDSARSA